MKHKVIHTVEDQTAVTVREKDKNGLRLIATFDRDTQVSEWRAALQRDKEIEFAEGYAEARSQYRELHRVAPAKKFRH